MAMAMAKDERLEHSGSSYDYGYYQQRRRAERAEKWRQLWILGGTPCAVRRTVAASLLSILFHSIYNLLIYVDIHSDVCTAFLVHCLRRRCIV